MYGKVFADKNGCIVETLSTMDTEPTLLVSRYRVRVMDGRLPFDGAQVKYGNQVWYGNGFACGTDNQAPESMEKLPIKRPRGMKVWRDGEWRKK